MREAVQGSTATGSYSPGILASGRFLFVSGQGPLTDGEVVPGDIREQTRLTMLNLMAVLAQSGLGVEHVVRCGVYLQSMDDFAAMDETYREFFSAPLPARTTIGASLGGISVEIDCVAVVPDDHGDAA